MLAQGEELLSLAVHYNDIEKLKAFLDTGVFNVNEICHEGISLLHVAATRNHEEVARMLIANGANVNAVVMFYFIYLFIYFTIITTTLKSFS